MGIQIKLMEKVKSKLRKMHNKIHGKDKKNKSESTSKLKHEDSSTRTQRTSVPTSITSSKTTDSTAKLPSSPLTSSSTTITKPRGLSSPSSPPVKSLLKQCPASAPTTIRHSLNPHPSSPPVSPRKSNSQQVKCAMQQRPKGRTSHPPRPTSAPSVLPANQCFVEPESDYEDEN